MPMIRVEMFEGRSLDQRRALVREITDAFTRTCGGDPEGVKIHIIEVSRQDWAAGGVFNADKDSGG